MIELLAQKVVFKQEITPYLRHHGVFPDCAECIKYIIHFQDDMQVETNMYVIIELYIVLHLNNYIPLSIANGIICVYALGSVL